MSAAPARVADYVLRAADGATRAVVELKDVGGAKDAPIEQVRELSEHFGGPAGLLLSPERVVLTERDGTVEAPAEPLIRSYLEETGAEVRDLRGLVWRMVAEDVLDDLLCGAVRPPSSWPGPLRDLFDRVRGGEVIREVRA